MKKYILNIFISLLLLLGQAFVQANPYENYAEFVQKYMPAENSESHLLIIKGELKQQITDILGHAYPALRIRYWQSTNRTLWILDEIGKTLPITTGFVIENGKIIDTQILAFRESRGYEVKYPQFTEQFSGVALLESKELTKSIDNVTGATLSVIAVKKVARLALFLDQHIKQP